MHSFLRLYIVSMRKIVVDETFCANRPICANNLLALMLVNRITQCVNQSQQEFTGGGVSILRPTDLYSDQTKPIALQIRCCPVFNA